MASIPASNRQLKVIRFFSMPMLGDISAIEAARMVRTILADPDNAERWEKYVYLTGDVGSKSADPKPFEPDALAQVVLPPGWTSAEAERDYRQETAARLLKDGVPYDMLAVVFSGRFFVFTGRFEFGPRTRCQEAVVSRGGLVPDSNWVTHHVDYLVVGKRGSERWTHREYGWKIEAAVVERETHGKPAIIQEAYWRSFL